MDFYRVTYLHWETLPFLLLHEEYVKRGFLTSNFKTFAIAVLWKKYETVSLSYVKRYHCALNVCVQRKKVNKKACICSKKKNIASED